MAEAEGDDQEGDESDGEQKRKRMEERKKEEGMGGGERGERKGKRFDLRRGSMEISPSLPRLLPLLL